MRCQHTPSFHRAAATKMFICLMLRQLPGPERTSGPCISGASLNRMVLRSSALDKGRTPVRETIDARCCELRALLPAGVDDEPSSKMSETSTKASSSSPWCPVRSAKFMGSTLAHTPVSRVSRALKSVSTSVALGIRWRRQAWYTCRRQMCPARPPFDCVQSSSAYDATGIC